MVRYAMLVALGAVTASAVADVTLHADSEFGTNTVTIDEDNLLEFLDLTLTTDISYNDMVNDHLAEGGTYHGWRHATEDEVLGLIQSAGVEFGDRPYELVPTFVANQLSFSLGRTFNFGDGDLSRGVYERVEGDARIIEFGPARDPSTFKDEIAYYNEDRYGESEADDETGHYLVREVPPEDCQADLNDDGQLDFFDVTAFVNAFTAQDDAADLDENGMFNFFDVSLFLAAFNAGCP